jgi:ATP-binding protein involved in chromosome partitioning
MPSEEVIRNALKAVKYPGYSRDIVSFGLVTGITVSSDTITVCLELSTPRVEVAQRIKADCEKVLRALGEGKQVRVELHTPGGASGRGVEDSPWSRQRRVAGVERVIAVASGKGGVGKSTVAVNLACALVRLGRAVGLLDCDVYGPSIPLMMGINQPPILNETDQIVPPVNHGVKLMSMGFLVDGETPVIWRGPMIQKTIEQFVNQVAWGELDYLLVDLPPGTGDAQLSLCQTVPLDGGVIVTTPQEASLIVVRKGIAMFEKVNVRILGIIENMSYYTTPTGERVEIFGHGGGRAEAARHSVGFLGEIPIFTEICLSGDRGLPVVVSGPGTPPGRAFIQLAEVIEGLFRG